MASLYGITNDYIDLKRQIEEAKSDDELRDLQEILASIDDDIEKKAENYARLIEDLKMFKEGCKKQKEKFTQMERTSQRKIDMLKNNLESSMMITGKRKFRTDNFSFRIQKNAPSVEIVDERKIPDEYFKVKREIDKAALKTAIKDDGLIIDGARLVQKESLRIV